MVVLGSMADRGIIVRPDGSMIVPVVSLFISVFESSPPEDIPCLMTSFTVTTAFLYFSSTCRPATALSSAKQRAPQRMNKRTDVVTGFMIPLPTSRYLAPVRFHFQVARVNSPQYAQDGELRLLLRQFLHPSLERDHIRDGD